MVELGAEMAYWAGLVVACLVIGVLIFGGYLVLLEKWKTRGTIEITITLEALPYIFYLIAVFSGVVLLGFTVLNFEKLSAVEIGVWIGYTIGSVLSILAVGRVIELLQQIRSFVRDAALRGQITIDSVQHRG